jgi:hypothetical protein
MAKKISDEIRDWCNCKDLGIHDVLCRNAVLRALADRIDSEMMELPKDKDGMPIHVGDKVWMADKGALELTVRSITLHACGEVNVDASCEGCHAHVGPDDLTHECPDSFERIADELDEMVDAADSADDNCEKLADLADRIRKLAAKDER